MTARPILERIAADEVALGLIVRLVRSGEIGRIASATGHDFIFIDGQHALFSSETVARLIEAANGCSVAPLVRVRGWNDSAAPLFLDAGAAGIIVPDVQNADQARAIVHACRFPPRGARSLPGPLVQNNFRPFPAEEAMRAADESTMLVAMIETVEAVANIDEIAAIDGLDVLHVGSVDLLLDLGKPGQHGCAEIDDAIARVAQAARRHGKILGIGGERDAARRKCYIAQGARFMTTDTDIALLMRAADTVVADIR